VLQIGSGTTRLATTLLPQGSTAAPEDFSLLMECLTIMMRNAKLGITTVSGLYLGVLNYADNIALVAASVEEAREMTKVLVTFCDLWN